MQYKEFGLQVLLPRTLSRTYVIPHVLSMLYLLRLLTGIYVRDISNYLDFLRSFGTDYLDFLRSLINL